MARTLTKPGRKPSPNGPAKTKAFHMLFTPADWQQVEAAAIEQGISVAELIHQALRQAGILTTQEAQ